MRVFTASLALTFVLSMLIDNGAARHVALTGTVTQFRRGHSISVMNPATDRGGVQIVLRNTTVYEDRDHDPALDFETLKPGIRVTVWYRMVGERHPVADKLRVEWP